MRSACVRAGRLPVPHAHRRAARHRGGRAGDRIGTHSRRADARVTSITGITGPVRFGMLAYGPSARMHREAAVALLTVRAYAPAGSEVIVLTDHPEEYVWVGDQ